MTRESARALFDGMAKPLGSLGRLEELGIQLAAIQGTDRPKVRNPVVAVFAGDHGAVRSGVISAYPSAVTAAMVGLYLQRRAAINILARQAGARVLVVDSGVDAALPDHPDLLSRKIARGTLSWADGPAMTPQQADQAMEAGGDILKGLDSNVVGLGDMGIGNTASAALLIHKTTLRPLVVGAGAGLDEAGVERKRALMLQAAARTPELLNPYDALMEYGGFEIAMLTGAILAAPGTGKCLIIDGLIVTAAAVLAHAIAPACIECCIFGHQSAEFGHSASVSALGGKPLLDLGLRLGEGTGAALAIPILQSTCALMSGMAHLAEVV